MIDISFRHLTQDDLSMLCNWLNRPHVAEWWGSSSTIEDIGTEYLSVIAGNSSAKAYIASLGQEPIGFIQVYVVMGSGDGWWEEETDPGARGIDQFLADGSRLNQGMGTAMIGSFVQALLEDPMVTKVQADPAPTNLRAIHCYMKAGFKSVGEIVTPDGPALLMRYEREA